LIYIDINQIAKKEKYLLDYDKDNQCHILDDDAVQDYLDAQYFQSSRKSSGLVIDYHSAGIVPETDDIHGIFVIRCSNEKLYDRLKERDYSQEKIDQNIQSEIFQVCLDEARESFDETIVHELVNENDDDLKRNLQYLRTWIDQWPLNPRNDDKTS
jgi:adenylate kinase